MKYCITVIAAFICLSCSTNFYPSTGVPATPSIGETSSVNMEESILRLINDHRRSKGLPALQMNSIASEQALQHSRNMATGKTAFSHNGFDQRIQNIKKEMGTTFIAASAENVAYGQMDASAVVKGWLNSSGHKKNIEGNYNLTGIGVAKDRKGDLYFTQIFLKK